MDRNYTAYKCQQCGTVFIIPAEYVDYTNNYVTCPLHGQHTSIIVIGAYSGFKECLEGIPGVETRRHGK